MDECLLVGSNEPLQRGVGRENDSAALDMRCMPRLESAELGEGDLVARCHN